MNVSIRQLRDFAAVAMAGSLTQAAKDQYVAQPVLTHQIKRLESELGVSVFARGPRGVTLTSEGEQLLEQAKLILHEYDVLHELAERVRRHAVGALRVGFMAQGPGEFLYETLRTFRNAHPNVDVTLHQFGFKDCFIGVTRELTDVAFTMGTLDENDGVGSEPILKEPMVVAMAAHHPLASRSRLHISEVIDQPLFSDVHPPGRWRDYWDATAHRGGKPPQIVGRAANHDEWLEEIRLSGGISLCPKSTPSYYPRSGLAFIPLDGVEPIIHWVIWHKATSNRHVDEFVRTVVAIARQAAPSEKGG